MGSVELGTFVGYTAVRLARASCMQSQGSRAVVTVEVDPVQACIARHIIDLGRLSCTAEVWIGQSRDVLPRLLEEFSLRGVGLLFLDHKGQVFHADLAYAECLDLL